LALASVLPLWRKEHWIIRVCAFPRLQLGLLLAINTLAIGLLLTPSSWPGFLLLLISLLCTCYQLWWILPFTPFVPKSVKAAPDSEGSELNIMIANVKTSNRNYHKLLQLVSQYRPHLLLTLETDRNWQQHLDALDEDYPHSVKCPLDNLYGMHLYSRLPLINPELKYLVEADKPSIHTLIELPRGQQVEAHFLHPAPPSPTENTESAERDAELLVVARALADTKSRPVVVAGDLNDVAWSVTTRLFKKLSGLLDPRVGRGLFNSFHADYFWLRWPLDHLFHSHHFKIRTLQRLPHFGSDHFPILSQLVLTDSDNRQQQSLSASSQEQSWAQSKHKKEDVSKDDIPHTER
jgi:endonuclease/exonuclease/phosphatase (EEP) superfamily protein YafD